MDRYVHRDGASFQEGEVYVNLQFTAGAAGAVPAFSAAGWRRKGIASVVLTATGIYTVTFQDSYVSLMDISWNIFQAVYSVTSAGQIVIKPAEILVSSNPATIALRCFTNNGVATAAALASGDVLQARFSLSRMAENA